MGYIRHDAIVVTGWDRAKLELAHIKALALGLPVSEIVNSLLNNYISFLIAPDGSKEGWEDSDAGAAARQQWKQWAKVEYNDHDLWIDWVHISYAGDDPKDTKIIDQWPQ